MKIVDPAFEIITPIDETEILKMLETVGRTCYKSEDKITKDSCQSFISGIIKRGHEAVIEHSSFIFEMNDLSLSSLEELIKCLSDKGFNSFLRITYDKRPVVSGNVRAWRDFLKCVAQKYCIPGYMQSFIYSNPILFPEYQNSTFSDEIDEDFKFVLLHPDDLISDIERLTHIDITVRLTNDRGVSHEEVRHRIASYAQESTRYCNYSKDKFGNEITYIDIKGGMELDPKVSKLDAATFAMIYDEWVQACKDAENHYNKMISLGASPQIARSVLNNSTKTEICITMNLREWRHFFDLRCSPAAHPQMREIAIKLLKAFKMMIPVIFDDLYQKYVTDAKTE